MSSSKLLYSLAFVCGCVLGWAVFQMVHQAIPSPLTDATSGPFTPDRLLRRLFMAVPIVGGLGGAALAGLAWRIGDWAGSSRTAATVVLGSTATVTASFLGSAVMPDAHRAITGILPFTGPFACLGASLTWWFADAWSSDLL